MSYAYACIHKTIGVADARPRKWIFHIRRNSYSKIKVSLSFNSRAGSFQVWASIITTFFAPTYD